MSTLGITVPPRVSSATERAVAFLGGGGLAATTARRVVLSLLFVLVVDLAFGLTPFIFVNGVALGALYGIVGVALVLVYKTSRIINFAAAAVGAVPAITAVLLSTSQHISYLLTMPIAVVGGLLSGALTEMLVMRRFKRTSRLIVTVVTIGVAQGFAALGFFIPIWFGEKATGVPKVETPWQGFQITNSRGNPILTGNQLFAFGVVVVLTFGLMLFLKRSRMGIALRAAAENGDRAELLGVPVDRVNTVAWAIAGLLSAMAIFSIAPLYGVPGDATLGFQTLLYGLAAAVVARMENLGLALLMGMGIGLVIISSVANTGSNDLASAIMLPIILAALLVQRRSRSRAIDVDASSWQAVAVFRPVPQELRAVPEVQRARFAMLVLPIALAIVLPFVLTKPSMPGLQLLPIVGIIAVSLVILTGWAGQISLGQYGLVGIGAAAAGGLIGRHNIDFFAAIGIGIAAGALTAVVIGLPAVRIRGLFLAVTTLAFGFAIQNYVLKTSHWIGAHIMPDPLAASIRRPMLYGKFDLEDDRAFYFLCLGFLLLVLAAAMSFRRHHSGRMLIALRDNQRAATSYSIAPVRTRLAAFAISGGIAGLAGVLFAYQQHNVIPGTYDVLSSVSIFLAAAVGGLGSLAFATLSVVAFQATLVWGPMAWHHLGESISSVIPLLLTGPLLIVNLYANPGGLAGWAFGERDKWLRRVARRNSIHVPSLVADSLVEPDALTTPEPAPKQSRRREPEPVR
ncbi:MAG TPA: ABC transporter permease [Mycobacteriales bacterium]|nr:ABC transporter permease [Mycobacteriales bacterium]